MVNESREVSSNSNMLFTTIQRGIEKEQGQRALFYTYRV